MLHLSCNKDSRLQCHSQHLSIHKVLICQGCSPDRKSFRINLYNDICLSDKLQHTRDDESTFRFYLDVGMFSSLCKHAEGKLNLIDCPGDWHITPKGFLHCYATSDSFLRKHTCSFGTSGIGMGCVGHVPCCFCQLPTILRQHLQSQPHH